MSWSVRQAVEGASAAGEPTRLRILALLAREELAVLELGRILGQSQPRVSRHLRLLAEAGLVERFPDGSWVFYRLATEGPGAALVQAVLGALDLTDEALRADSEQLESVQRGRRTAAAAYFARNAEQWDHLRSLQTDEAEVERAISGAAGPGPFERLIDLGTGTGRMLRLLAPQARRSLGLDLSHQMLNVARAETTGLERCELRHGDILATGLPGGAADLVVVHQVLHYLGEPAAAVAEAGRLVAPGGRLLVVDFAPHELEHLREAHQHRRLGFTDEEIARWTADAGLAEVSVTTLPPARSEGLTVKVWCARRPHIQQRVAA
ncbi:MAG: metalloregulator ArsR/SmtB family transcription factor [Proteobacteria bacterium]|nr:metalloregulator ArsR/SmtB family transcription factor [Pseudomonadota bacterium]